MFNVRKHVFFVTFFIFRLIVIFISKQVETQRELISGLETELDSKRKSAEKLLSDAETIETESVELREQSSNLDREREVRGRTCEQLKLERGQLLRESLALSQEHEAAVDSERRAENHLARSQAMKNVIAGVKAVEKIVDYLVL